MKTFSQIWVAAISCLLLTSSALAASPEQAGTFSGKLSLKGVDPLTGDKLSTKSLVLMSVALDNSTTLTVDSTNYFGGPENSFTAGFANIAVVGPGSTLITAPLKFKKGKYKGAISSLTLSPHVLFSTGKLNLKSVDTTPPPGFSEAIHSTNIPKPILDVTTATSVAIVPSVGLVRDVTVTLNITHTFTGDLDIFLKSPSGTVVELCTDNGGTGENLTNTTFDQTAAKSITLGTAPFTGHFLPEENFAKLDGEASEGEWSLIIFDDTNVDTGTLNSWSLQINKEPLSF